MYPSPNQAQGLLLHLMGGDTLDPPTDTWNLKPKAGESFTAGEQMQGQLIKT